MTKGKEGRRYPRFKVDLMEINGTMMFANEVEVLDISVGGISLRADRRMNIGTEYSLKIKDKTSVIPLKGTVVWSLLSGTRKTDDGGTLPFYTAGMRFTGLSAERIAELTRFIASHRQEYEGEIGIHSLSGLRFNIRFNIEAEEKAVLDYHEDYRVKKISLGGMLIESLHELAVERKMPMELLLPGESAVTFEGRVASCLPLDGEDPKRYDVGIEFIGMQDGDRGRLTTFIATLSERLAGSGE